MNNELWNKSFIKYNTAFLSSAAAKLLFCTKRGPPIIVQNRIMRLKRRTAYNSDDFKSSIAQDNAYWIMPYARV